jgi:hypothetical protein
MKREAFSVPGDPKDPHPARRQVRASEFWTGSYSVFGILVSISVTFSENISIFWREVFAY